MDLHLKNRSVIVTGASSNIGRAIALGFATEGAKVVIADIDTQKVQSVRSKLPALRHRCL